MTNMAFSSIEEYNDPEAKNRYHQLLLEGVPPEEALRTIQLESRDNARTPMQWDSSPHAGFTTGTPWLQVNPNYTKINAAAQERDPCSILHFYRRLIALRREQPALSRGGLALGNGFLHALPPPPRIRQLQGSAGPQARGPAPPPPNGMAAGKGSACAPMKPSW